MSEEDKIEIINKVKNSDILTDLNTLYKQGVSSVDPTEISGLIKGRKNVYDHIQMMIKKAKKTVYIATGDAGLKNKLKHAGKTLDAAKNRGVDVKIVSTAKGKQDTKLPLKTISKKSRFILIDDKEALIMLTDDDQVHPDYDVGIWVNSKLLTGTLSDYFNSQWK